MKFNKTNKDYNLLIDFIRGEMKRQKISQADLAYRLNIPQTGVSKRLSGNVDWSMWEIVNVFEILHVKFKYEKEEEQ